MGTIFRYIFLLYLNRINVYPLSCSYVTDRNRLWTLTHTVDIHTHTLHSLRLGIHSLTQIVDNYIVDAHSDRTFIHSDCGHIQWRHPDCRHSLRLRTLAIETLRLQTLAVETLTQTVDTCNGDTHPDRGHSLRLPFHKNKIITVSLALRKLSGI